MAWLNNLKVVQKLALLVAILLAAVIVVGGTGYYFLGRANDTLEKMYNEKMAATNLLIENRNHSRAVQADTFNLMLTSDKQENDALLKDIDERTKVFNDNLTKVAALNLDNEQKTGIDKVKADFEQYHAIRDQVLTLAAQNRNAEAYALYTQQGKPLMEVFNKDLAAVSEQMDKAAVQMNQASEKEFAFVNRLFIGIIVVAIILGVLLGWLITQRIQTRLKEIVEHLKIIAKGDFSQEVSAASLADKSEFGSVSRAVAAMSTNVKKLITHLMDTAERRNSLGLLITPII